MKLTDVKGTMINVDKVSILNDAALNRDTQQLTLILDNIRYIFDYNSNDDMVADYNAIRDKMETK